MDPDSCVNWVVEDCHIDVGDDGVSIKAYNVAGVGPAPCVNVTIRRTDVISRNICVGGATEGGVRDIVFEDMAVGSPDAVTSPWAIKFKVATGHLRNITFRRLTAICKISDRKLSVSYYEIKGRLFCISQ